MTGRADHRWIARYDRNTAAIQSALREHSELDRLAYRGAVVRLVGARSTEESDRQFEDVRRRLADLELEISRLEHERGILGDELVGAIFLMFAMCMLVVMVPVLAYRAWNAVGPIMGLYIMSSISAGFMLGARRLRPYREPRAASRMTSR